MHLIKNRCLIAPSIQLESQKLLFVGFQIELKSRRFTLGCYSMDDRD